MSLQGKLKISAGDIFVEIIKNHLDGVEVEPHDISVLMILRKQPLTLLLTFENEEQIITGKNAHRELEIWLSIFENSSAYPNADLHHISFRAKSTKSMVENRA